MKEFQTLNAFYKVPAELLEGSTKDSVPQFDDPCLQMLAFYSHTSLFEDSKPIKCRKPFLEAFMSQHRPCSSTEDAAVQPHPLHGNPRVRCHSTCRCRGHKRFALQMPFQS